MSTHYLGFYEEISKINSELNMHFICSSEFRVPVEYKNKPFTFQTLYKAICYNMVLVKRPFA